MAWSKESRHSRDYGPEWEKLRVVAIKRANHLCEECARHGRTTLGKDVDHIVSRAKAKTLRWPRSKTEHVSNLQYLCRDCHKAKTAEENGQTYRPKVVIGEDGWPIEK